MPLVRPRLPFLTRLTPLALLALLPAACGDDGPGQDPDAALPVDARPGQDPDAAAPGVDAPVAVDAAPGQDAPGSPDAGAPVCSADGLPPPGTRTETCEPVPAGPETFLRARDLWVDEIEERHRGTAACEVVGASAAPLLTALDLACEQVAGDPFRRLLRVEIVNSRVVRLPEALAVGSKVALAAVESNPDSDDPHRLWLTLRSAADDALLLGYSDGDPDVLPPQSDLDPLGLTQATWLAPLSVTVAPGLCATEDAPCGGTVERAALDVTLPGTGTARILDHMAGYVGHAYLAVAVAVEHYSSPGGCVDNQPNADLLLVALNECDLAPAVDVHFPPLYSQTELDTVTVRGTAVDNTGIAAIRVNGVPATTSNDFASWQAVVPLQPGANAIVVESEDDAGNVDQAAARLQVMRRTIVRTASVLASDPAGAYALIGDVGLSGILRMDLATNEITTLPGGALSAAPELEPVIAMALDPAANRAFVLDDRLEDNPDTVLAIDLATGFREVISDDRTGSGRPLIVVQAMAADPARGRLVLTDDVFGAIVGVDLATGDRTVLSDASTGIGPLPGFLGDLTLSADGGQAFVAAQDPATLLAVDLATGNRTVISDAGTGTGPELFGPMGIALDAARNRVLITEIGPPSLLAVDLATGNRTLLSGDGAGAGPDLIFPKGVALDAARNRALIADVAHVVSVDLATGNRTRVTQQAVGTGTALQQPASVVMDDATGRALIVEGADMAVVALDLWNSDTAGQRALVSTGTGAPGEPPGDMAFDLARKRALVLDRPGNALFTVDLATGQRALLSGAGAGTGPALSAPRAVAVDTSLDRALIIQSGVMLAVDLTTGNRTIVSSDNDTAPFYDDPFDIAVASRQQEALVADQQTNLLSVFLPDGSRRILSREDIGTGPSFFPLEGVAFDLARQRALVTQRGDDETPAHVFAVSLSNGNRTIVAGGGAGAGPRIFDARGITVDERRSIALITSTSPAQVFALDLVTLQRVLVAQ
jgi:DNA-binding beta-propeller fold protein YncE